MHFSNARISGSISLIIQEEHGIHCIVMSALFIDLCDPTLHTISLPVLFVDASQYILILTS